ncbi:MAG: acyltransferase, partial [Halobacteriales archaeon]|nr:acyltransferase [Halobacteriales archaeon]
MKHGRPPTEHVESSALQAYLDLQVGDTGLLGLAKYELLASFGAILPGAVGLVFRKLFWPRLFADCGRGVVWGRNVVLRHPGKMSIGDGVLVDDHCFFDAKGSGDGAFRIGRDVLVSRGCVVSGKGGDLDVGDRVNIGVGCQIWSMGGLTIEADCWLGAGVVVLAGVTVGRGSIVGAGSVVTKDLPPYSIAVGAPAKVIRRRRGAPP